MAAMMASVAAVSGQEVLVFLSMNALPNLIKGRTVKAPHEGEMGELMAGYQSSRWESRPALVQHWMDSVLTF